MTIVLHHYDASPFSELLRLALGIKNAEYWSVTVPTIAPKPLLTPLTGGYRKTPVLQVDADVYCDSAAAIEVIELLPGPSLFPAPLGRAGALVAALASGPMFYHAVGSAMLPVLDWMGEDFWRDREALFGFTRVAVETRAPHNRAQFRAGLARVEASLDGDGFVGGGTSPGYADLALYVHVWFQRRFTPEAPVLDDFPRVRAWEARIKAIGHGRPASAQAEDALALAHGATPDLSEHVAPGSEFAAGQDVTVATEDPGANPVTGTLLRLDDRTIAIRRDDPDCGTVAVHFPRAGQILRAG